MAPRPLSGARAAAGFGSARVGLSPEEQAKGLAGSAAREAAMVGLRALGLSDEQISLLASALRMSPEALLALGKEKLFAKLSEGATLATAYARAAISEQAVRGMRELGFSQAEAEALAATGGDLEKLKALGKERLSSLVKDLDERLKKEGVDIAAQAAKGLGIPPEKLAGVVKGATVAYDIFTTVLSASEVLGASTTFSRSEWGADTFKGDASLLNLSRSLDQMAYESEAARTKKASALRQATAKLAGTLAAVPGYGWMAAGIVTLGVEFANALGWFEASKDDNSQEYSNEAAANAKRLWDQYGFAPAAFDSTAMSLASYARDSIGWELQLLDASEGKRPWREAWRKVVTWAYFQPLEGADTKAHPAALGLQARGWLPLQFSEWIGGAAPVMSRNLGGENKLSMIPGGMPVGTVGDRQWIMPVDPFLASMFLFRVMPGLARDMFYKKDGNIPSWYPGFGFPKRTIVGKRLDKISGFVVKSNVEEPSVIAPRSPALQRLIRERMAATVATLVAAANNIQIESAVEACVKRARYDMDAHGFDPSFAAEDFANVYFEADNAVRKSQKKVRTFNTVDLNSITNYVKPLGVKEALVTPVSAAPAFLRMKGL